MVLAIGARNPLGSNSTPIRGDSSKSGAARNLLTQRRHSEKMKNTSRENLRAGL